MRLRIKKRFIALLVILLFLTSSFFYVKAQYVIPILMYHRIDNNAAISKLIVSPESFRKQMSFLKRRNYNIVRLEDIPELMEKKKLPYKTAAITFDDGYEDNYKNAYPVLKELGLVATIFIIPSLIGMDGYLTWDQVVEMVESGVISIGSHTMTHPYLQDLSGTKLDIEIFDSKRAIESHIRRGVDSFSYPLGGFNDYIRERVKAAGYKIAVATNPGKDYPKHEIFSMKRLRISRTSDNLFVFWIETSGFYTWIKEIRDED